MTGELRVALDSGGIAAGAGEILEELRILCAAYPGLKVIAVGTPGMCYADPQVEVVIAGLPQVSFGNLTPEAVHYIFREFLEKKQFPDQEFLNSKAILIGGRIFGQPGAEPPQYILLCNTQIQGSPLPTEMISAFAAITKVAIADNFGFYNQGLAIQLFPSGAVYANLSEDDLLVIAQGLSRGELPSKKFWLAGNGQTRIASRNCGVINPESLSSAVAAGAYEALKKALSQMSPQQVIEEVHQSGLRGRGGAGYPTGKKWHLTALQPSPQRYVICNGDEGDPGAFMDRSLLESDPHRVLEGLILAGYAIGASTGYFYIRAEYPLAIARVRQAVREAREAGILGKNIFGSNFSFDVKIRLGAGAYVCGEETALIASIEGKRGSPVPRPPYPSQRGLHGQPTCINNVETLAFIPAIVLQGGQWYASIGRGTSTGTKVFAVSGHIRRTQLVEVAMGTTVHEVVFNICGGLPPGHNLKAVQTGGPSGGMIPASLLDTPLTYEDILAIGSIIGSGGMVVMDDRVNMAEVMRFFLSFNTDESCGKCAPCRVGGFQLRHLYEELCGGRGEQQTIPQIERIAHAMQAASLCGLGKAAPNPIFSTLRYFREDYLACLK